MECNNLPRRWTEERLESDLPTGVFDVAATPWPVGQPITYLHATDQPGLLSHGRTSELLSERADAGARCDRLIEAIPMPDLTLRWSCLLPYG